MTSGEHDARVGLDGTVIGPMAEADYHEVVMQLDGWWGGPSVERAQPVFFRELGADALAARAAGVLAGFLFGFRVPTKPPYGYVHLVGIAPDWRRRGLGKALYRAFGQRMAAGGATTLKAIAPPGNDRAVGFHRALGFEVRREADYAGRSRARLVFSKTISVVAV